MVFAFSGSFALTMRSCETVLGSHSLLYLPAGEMHANVFGSHGAGVFITAIDPAWIGDRLEVVNADADRPRIAPAGYLRGLAHKMYEEFKSPDALSDLIVEGAFLELLGRWFRDGFLQHRDAPAWMRRVKALLQDSFRDPLSLKDVAQVAGVHPSHVAREFHRIYGMTVGDYIRKLRVEFVAEQLVQPHKRKKEDTVSLTDLALCDAQACDRNDSNRISKVPRNHINPLIEGQCLERQGLDADLASPQSEAVTLSRVADILCSQSHADLTGVAGRAGRMLVP